jgi:hypothetical protein
MASFGERVVGAMKLDANTFEEIERDQTAISQTVGVITIAAVSNGIGWIWYNGISGIIGGVIGGLIGYTVWSALVWVVGTKMMPEPQTKADFAETFRVVGFAASPGVLSAITIIPGLGWLLMVAIWIWQIAAMVVAVRQVLDYSETGKAILVVVIGFIVYLAVAMTVGAMFGLSSMMGRSF